MRLALNSVRLLEVLPGLEGPGTLAWPLGGEGGADLSDSPPEGSLTGADGLGGDSCSRVGGDRAFFGDFSRDGWGLGMMLVAIGPGGGSDSGLSQALSRISSIVARSSTLGSKSIQINSLQSSVTRLLFEKPTLRSV